MTKDGRTDAERQEHERYMRLLGLPQGYIDHNFAFIDKEKHREISSRGGKRSGEVRRKKAEHNKELTAMLNRYFFEGYTEQDIKDFRKWQRHRRYLQKKREAAGKQ